MADYTDNRLKNQGGYARITPSRPLFLILNYAGEKVLTDKYAPVAQWLEHHSYKVGVDGSSPSWRT